MSLCSRSAIRCGPRLRRMRTLPQTSLSYVLLSHTPHTLYRILFCSNYFLLLFNPSPSPSCPCSVCCQQTVVISKKHAEIKFQVAAATTPVPLATLRAGNLLYKILSSFQVIILHIFSPVPRFILHVIFYITLPSCPLRLPHFLHRITLPSPPT